MYYDGLLVKNSKRRCCNNLLFGRENDGKKKNPYRWCNLDEISEYFWELYRMWRLSDSVVDGDKRLLLRWQKTCCSLDIFQFSFKKIVRSKKKIVSCYRPKKRLLVTFLRHHTGTRVHFTIKLFFFHVNESASVDFTLMLGLEFISCYGTKWREYFVDSYKKIVQCYLLMTMYVCPCIGLRKSTDALSSTWQKIFFM